MDRSPFSLREVVLGAGRLPTGLLVVVWCVLAGWAISKGEVPTAEEIERLVAQLGAERFEEREAASQRLWELGNAALPALREAVRSDEPEISLRARKILGDLDLGIFPDTPAESVALISEFHKGDLKEKENVLRRLNGDENLLVRIRLILSERNAEWRSRFIKEFGGTGDALLGALREAGELEAAYELLALVSPRDWAVYLLLRGEAGAEIARLKEQWEVDQEKVDARLWVWLLLVTENLAEARAVADRSADEGLRREVYLRQADWEALVALPGPMPGDNPVEKLGYQAMFFSKAGKEEKARKALEELAALELDDDYVARNRMHSLCIFDRWDLATKSFEKPGEMGSHELDFLSERLEMDRLFARLEVEPPGRGAAGMLEKRIEKVLELEDQRELTNARRELFYFCRSVAELLVRVGEREEAQAVFLATRILAREDPSFLGYLAASCRSAGFVKEADAIGLEALEAGGISSFLNSGALGDRAVAQLWWGYLRATTPDEELPETLQRVTELMAPEEERKGDPIPAMADVVKWIETLKSDQQATHYGALATICRAREDWNSALDYLRKQSALSRTPDQPLMEAGNMMAERERWEEAAKLYGEAAEVGAKPELAVYLHGHVLSRLGEKEEGEARMKRAHLMPLANSMRRSSFAFGLARRGLQEEARAQWKMILRTAPYDEWDGMEAWALRNASMQLAKELAKEHPGEAAELLERYLHSFLQTNSSMSTRYYVIYKARIHALRFEECMAAGKIEEAMEFARRAVAARPGNSNFVIEVVEEFTKTGQGTAADEFYEALAARYRAVLERFPNSAREHNSLAWLAGRCGRDLEEALVHARTATRLVPDHSEYLDTLAEVHFRLGNREKAIELARRCLELDPETEQYREQLARFQEDEPR